MNTIRKTKSCAHCERKRQSREYNHTVECHKPVIQEWMTVTKTKCCAHCERKRQSREYKHTTSNRS